MISLWQGIIRNGKNSWQVFHSRNRRECLREGPGPGSCLREAPEAGPAPSPAILGMRQVCSSSWKCISYLTGFFFVKSQKAIQSLKVIWTLNTSCLCSRPCQDDWDQLWFGREIQLHQGDISVHNITTIWLSSFRSWSLVSSANPWQVPLTLDYLIQQTFFHIHLLKYVLRCWRQW